MGEMADYYINQQLDQGEMYFSGDRKIQRQHQSPPRYQNLRYREILIETPKAYRVLSDEGEVAWFPKTISILVEPDLISYEDWFTPSWEDYDDPVDDFNDD